MTAREQFLSELAQRRRSRVRRGRACPKCHRPNGWMCKEGRPCARQKRDRTNWVVKGRSEYWREYYQANREKKLAAANAREQRIAAEKRAAKRKPRRTVRRYAISGTRCTDTAQSHALPYADA